MAQSAQGPTPQVPAGPRSGAQKDGGKGRHISTIWVVEPAGGGEGLHSTIAVQALKLTDSVLPGLQTPTVPSSEETDTDNTKLDREKGSH